MTDHAWHELLDTRAGEDDGVSRGALLKGAALGAGAAAAAALSAAAPALAQGRPSRARDVQILNFLLLNEYLLEAFYAAAVDKGALTGELAEYAQTVLEHERAHMSSLEDLLGADARSAPQFDFGDKISSNNAFAAAALELEETASAAYIGQGANLTRKNILEAARIVSVEARHAAWVRDIAGKLPAPNAADAARSEKQVMRSLRRGGYIG
jgi:hypothetical protein